MTVGGFVSFLAYSNQYTKPFNEISGVVTELQNALACAARIFELIDEKPEESDENCSALSDPEGSVEFDNVRFSYDKSKKLIDGFDFFALVRQDNSRCRSDRLRQDYAYQSPAPLLRR